MYAKNNDYTSSITEEVEDLPNFTKAAKNQQNHQCIVPLSWYGDSTHNLEIEGLKKGLSKIDAISLAVARKYGTHEYFVMHREEREKVNGTEIYLDICKKLEVDVSDKKVLVVGVNDGIDIESFNYCQVIGVDPCHLAIALSRKNFPNHQFHIAVAENIPIPDSFVEIYIALRVINCSTVNLEDCLNELQRTLKVDGGFIFSIATVFFENNQVKKGVFKNGRVDTEHADSLKNQLLNELKKMRIQPIVLEHTIETFIFGWRTT